MDESTTGGTMFYRVSDKRFDATNVKDTTLHTAFGDLSDGANSALNIRAGKNSRVVILDFVIAEPPAFSQDATLVGYDLNLHSVMDSRVYDASSDKEDLTSNPYLDIFLLEKGNTIKYEGNIKPLDNQSASYEYRILRGENWEQEEIATFVASMSTGATKTLQENFSGTSDVNVNLNTTQGKVREFRTPYITVDEAYDNKNQTGHIKHPRFGMSKDEMFLLYGESSPSNGRVIKLEAADENVPPEKWKPLVKRGSKGSLMKHPSVSAVSTLAGVDLAASAASGQGLGMASGTARGALNGYNYGGHGLSGAGKVYKMADDGTNLMQAGKRSGIHAGGQFSTTSKTAKLSGFYANSNRAMAGSSRMASSGAGSSAGLAGGIIVGAAIGTYYGVSAGLARNKSLKAASNTGDFSGVTRPITEPTWKNKNIKDMIKYDVVADYATITQFDENAITTTTTWFDQVNEVRDYPKLEIITEGVADGATQMYGSSEKMLAKSSINFGTGKDGQCMSMISYCDMDLGSLPYNQDDVNFNSPKSPLQQDIFVSKYNLPAPVNIFQNNPNENDIDNSSTGNSGLVDPWELSWDMKINELAIPYTIFYDSADTTTTGTNFSQTLRRCIAVTFSNKKPVENEDFYTYSSRHWSGPTDTGEAAWAGGSDMAGFVIDKTLEFTAGVPTFGKTMLTPIAFVSSAGTKHIEVYPTSATYGGANKFKDLKRDAGFLEIPQSTWLNFKMTCGLHGASGKAATQEGRYFLTVHDSGTGELITSQQTDGEEEGPIALCSTLDDVTETSSDTAPLNSPTKWLKHMTIWSVNHRYNAGNNFGNMENTIPRSSLSYFTGDAWAKSIQKVGATMPLLSDTTLRNDPYFLSKNDISIDNMKIKGIEPDIVNMTVNEENTTNSLTQNVFNENEQITTYHANQPSWSSGITTHEPITNNPATVLAMGFNTVNNIVGSTDENTEYMLFNDFWASSFSNTIRPTSFTNGQMKAGYNKGETKLGDWIDTLHTVEESPTNFNLSGTHNSSVTTISVSSTSPDSIHMLKVGDIVKVESEKMLVTAVNASDESFTAEREVCGTTAASHGSVAIKICGRSNFRHLLIGGQASGESFRDVNTLFHVNTGGGTFGVDSWDKNRTSAHNTYVEGFSQKGLVEFRTPMTGWVKSECIYASTKITDIGDNDTAKTAAVSVNKARFVISNTAILNFEKGANGEKYIIYKYGATSSFVRATGTAAIVNISSTGEVIEVTRNSSSEWGGSTDHDGAHLDILITEDNLPFLYISPYKYWMCFQFDAMDVDTEEVEQITERGYGAICSIEKPSFSGSTSLGHDFGATFNESRFYVDSDELTPYAAARTLDISDDASVIVKDTDFGMGAWDLDSAAGGMVTSFYPIYGINRVPVDALTQAASKAGETVSLLLSANGSNAKGSEFSFWSGDFTAGAGSPVPAYQSHAVPQLVTKYFVPRQGNPGLGVVPAEDSPFYAKYAFSLPGDFWYAYLIIDDEDIADQYHKIHQYIPCNDNTDGPWLSTMAMERGGSDGNMKRLRAFGDREAIGRDNVGAAGADFPIIYPTNTGLYSGTWGDSPARQSIQGLAGRCVDTRDGGSLTFPWVSGKVGGSGTQTQMSVVLNVIGEKSAADAEILQLAGKILISQISNKVVASVTSNRGGAHKVTLTSATSLPRDGVTPTNIMVTADTELPYANIKLFVNGKLEAQSGDSVVDAGAGAGTQWQHGTVIASLDSANTTFGTYDGLYEEILIYRTCIHPVDTSDNNGQYVLEKQIEELTNSTQGYQTLYNARLFACDYHNIRGRNVAMSPQVSFKKASFNIDGT
jgi:hypothetical protein